LFGLAGEPVAAGVCDAKCDPLADNDFLGSGQRVGSACRSTQGCYDSPAWLTGTRWVCQHELNASLVHRSECTLTNGCDNDAGNPRLDGCAQGYAPLVRDTTGASQIVCVAMCMPGNTYSGNPGTQYPAGQAPHACNTTDARGTFNTATDTNNGDHCMYSWLFEIDEQNNFVRSPTSDTVGFCIDHSKYKYDSNGDGLTNGSDANWPLCSSLLDGSGSGGDVRAADFGCVDTAHAGLMLHAAILVDVRLPKASLGDVP
jgi:hypothetical protein